MAKWGMSSLSLPADAPVQIEPEVMLLKPDAGADAQVVIQLMSEYYPLTAGRPVYWDLTAMDVAALTLAEMMAIATTAKSAGRVDRRKTAFLVGNARCFVAMCKYLNAAVEAGVRAEYMVFLDPKVARQWVVSP